MLKETIPRYRVVSEAGSSPAGNRQLQRDRKADIEVVDESDNDMNVTSRKRNGPFIRSQADCDRVSLSELYDTLSRLVRAVVGCRANGQISNDSLRFAIAGPKGVVMSIRSPEWTATICFRKQIPGVSECRLVNNQIGENR